MRKEYKYLVPSLLLDQLRRKINPFVYTDCHAQKQSNCHYTVRSVYFDSMRMDAYHEKLSGLKKRKKFRLRGYNTIENESLLFLEIKNKYNEFVYKQRAPLHYNQLNTIFQTESDFSESDLNAFRYHLNLRKLAPVLLIVYDREAYHSKFNSDLRITFDKNLRSRKCSSPAHISSGKTDHSSLHSHFIFEIKFNHGYPCWLKSIINEFNLARESVSKYCICVDKHKYELDHHFNYSSVNCQSHFLT